MDIGKPNLKIKSHKRVFLENQYFELSEKVSNQYIEKYSNVSSMMVKKTALNFAFKTNWHKKLDSPAIVNIDNKDLVVALSRMLEYIKDEESFKNDFKYYSRL